MSTKKGISKIPAVIGGVIMAGLLCLGVYSFIDSTKGNTKLPTNEKPGDKNNSSLSSTPSTGTSSVRFMAVGDNLIHDTIYKQAAERADGGAYDFSYAYADVADILSKADLSFINQETIIDSSKEPSTYPLFNSPAQLGDEMVKLGFNVVNMANNHVLDMNYDGAISAIAYWKNKGVTLTGAYESEDDMYTVKKNISNGITFSYVGVTSYLNGFNINPDETNLRVVSLTDDYRSEEEIDASIEKMIKLADEQSDVVVVSMHWSVENVTQTSEAQEQWVQQLVNWGADIIIGTGPHSLMPVKYVDKPDGGQAVVFYSLGNFISAQSDAINMPSGIADIVVEKDNASNKTSIRSVDFIPTITYYGDSQADLRILKFANYNTDMVHGISDMNCDYAKNLYETVIGKEFISLFRNE